MIMYLMGISYLIYICTRISINGTLFQKKKIKRYILSEQYLSKPNIT